MSRKLMSVIQLSVLLQLLPGLVQRSYGNNHCFTDPNITTLFSDSCRAAVASDASDVCPEAWNAFMGAFADLDPSDVNISSYNDYYEVFPIAPAPNEVLFWSGTPMITDFVSSMNENICSSFTMTSSEVINGLGIDACWCGTAGGGINYDTPCPGTATTAFWASFSCMLGANAEGVVFWLTWGERPGGAYQEGNFFALYEFPALESPRVSKLVVFSVHRLGMGESCGQGSLVTLENESTAKFGVSGGYSCYDIIGDAKTNNVTEQQRLAEMIVPIIRSEQSSALCSKECQNGGTCTGPDTCTCTEGWMGKTCTKRPVCKRQCMNGGTCTGRNECTCSSGWTGKSCQQRTRVCTPPCAKGGKCLKNNMCAYPSAYTCTAPNI